MTHQDTVELERIPKSRIIGGPNIGIAGLKFPRSREDLGDGLTQRAETRLIREEGNQFVRTCLSDISWNTNANIPRANLVLLLQLNPFLFPLLAYFLHLVSICLSRQCVLSQTRLVKPWLNEVSEPGQDHFFSGPS